MERIELTAEVLQERMYLLRLAKQAENILSELHERTGMDFSEVINGQLSVIGEIAPRLTQVMPRVKTEVEAF